MDFAFISLPSLLEIQSTLSISVYPVSPEVAIPKTPNKCFWLLYSLDVFLVTEYGDKRKFCTEIASNLGKKTDK